MSVLIGPYEFFGPYSSIAELADASGVFAVLHPAGEEEYELICLDHAENVKEAVAVTCADRRSPDPVLIAACYMPGVSAANRQKIAKQILDELDDHEAEVHLLD